MNSSIIIIPKKKTWINLFDNLNNFSFRESLFFSSERNDELKEKIILLIW